MKKKILLYLIIIFFFSISSVNSQITVSPEIGLSYLPFTLYPQTRGEFRIINSKELNFLLGVSAHMPIYKKWDAKLRISYANRNNVEWSEFRDFDPGSDFTWKHQDLNIDLNVRYQLSKNISVGIGPSLIRSFMERNQIEREDGEAFQLKINKFFFGLNAGISLKIKKATVNLMYLRTRRYNGEIPFRAPIGNNRLDFTVGYRIGKDK